MCSTDVAVVQNKPAAVAPRKPSPIISSFLELGRKKTVDAAKICGGAENVKTGSQQTFNKWIARFIARHLYSAGSACVLLTIIAWVAHRYGQLYLHCSLIYFWVPSSCFCIVINLSLGWNNPVQRCLPVGGGLHYPRRRRGGFTHWLTDCFDVQPTTTSGNVITQSIISALASVTPSCILHRAQQHHAQQRICMSVIAAFANQFSGVLSRWALWVMALSWLTAHDRQTMMQITRAE